MIYQHYFKYTTRLISILFSITMISTAAERIMPLGDSITYGNTISGEGQSGYRNYLWYLLQDAKRDVNFVGSVTAGKSVTPVFDTDNEGHPGWNQFEIAEETYEYMNTRTPDTVLLHVGTNDHGTTNPGGIDEILNFIDLYEAENKVTVNVYVALIIDREDIDGRIRIFNRRLAELLRLRIQNGDNISIVDMYNNVNLKSSDYADNTHPSNSGYKKMADIWFKALTEKFNPELSAFPYTLVTPTYIEYTTSNAESTSIEIVTEIPDSGITF